MFVAAAVNDAFSLDIDIAAGSDDKQTSAFVKSVWVSQEPREYSISFAEIDANSTHRPFDFSDVKTVVFSATKPAEGHQVLLDYIRLRH